MEVFDIIQIVTNMVEETTENSATIGRKFFLRIMSKFCFPGGGVSSIFGGLTVKCFPLSKQPAV